MAKRKNGGVGEAIAGLIVLAVVASFCGLCGDDEESSNHSDSPPPTEVASVEQKSDPALAEKLTKADQLLADVGPGCIESRNSMRACVSTISAASALVAAADRASGYEGDVSKEARVIATKIAKLQREWFPKMRNEFGPAVRPGLKEHGVGIVTLGGNYHVVRIWGEPLTDKTFRDKFKADAIPELRKLRFQSLEIRRTKGGSTVETLTLDAPADSDFVEWDGEKAQRLGLRPKFEEKPRREQRSCCMFCRTGKACGDSCISRDRTCNEPPGCACPG